MSLAAFFRDVRDRWEAFVAAVWPEGPAEATRAEQAWLERRIERRGRRLVALRGRIDRRLAALARQEGRLGDLSGTEWGRLREAVERGRAGVVALERRYAAGCAELDGLRAARRALGRGEVVAGGREE